VEVIKKEIDGINKKKFSQIFPEKLKNKIKIILCKIKLNFNLTN
jgi:hypothetical protein